MVYQVELTIVTPMGLKLNYVKNFSNVFYDCPVGIRGKQSTIGEMSRILSAMVCLPRFERQSFFDFYR